MKQKEPKSTLLADNTEGLITTKQTKLTASRENEKCMKQIKPKINSVGKTLKKNKTKQKTRGNGKVEWWQCGG